MSNTSSAPSGHLKVNCKRSHPGVSVGRALGRAAGGQCLPLPYAADFPKRTAREVGPYVVAVGPDALIRPQE